MTVTYTADVANGGKLISFSKVLMRWRGSLYKLIWRDLICYFVLFIAINSFHAYALPSHLQLSLYKVRLYLANNLYMFPVPFVLSFFVENVATKWWHQYQLLPSSDTLGIYTNAVIPGKDDQSRLMRRTIVRYAVLSLVLTMRNISIGIRKRFPTLKHVQEAGLMLEEERNHYDKLETQVTANNWIPLVWAANVANYARTLKKVSSDQCLRLLITELTAHRDKLGSLVSYDLVNIPLFYTQTMVVVVMSYVVITLLSHPPPIMDGVGFTGFGGFPMSSLSNFIIYVGLMKVATVMLNPFGKDDDDFELNAIVDRHLTAAYMIVDEMHEEEPEVVKDAYWDEIVPKELPYTVGSEGDRKQEFNYNKAESRLFKQHQNKFAASRQNSQVNQRKENATKKMNIKKTTLENDLLISDKNDLNLTNIYDNVGFYSSNNSLKEVDEDLYDCPGVTKSMNDFQQPSTSKQYFHRPRRF